MQVVPQKKIVMGYPQRLLVVEQVATLCPTWVVFDGYIVSIGIKNSDSMILICYFRTFNWL